MKYSFILFLHEIEYSARSVGLYNSSYILDMLPKKYISSSK